MEVITAIKIVTILKFIGNKLKIKTNTTEDKIIEPRAPDIVLFGLIFISLGPLKILPNTNPPISEAAQQDIKENSIIFVCK
jgi:hypothetical protein